jgi:hypothetical protein
MFALVGDDRGEVAAVLALIEVLRGGEDLVNTAGTIDVAHDLLAR